MSPRTSRPAFRRPSWLLVLGLAPFAFAQRSTRPPRPDPAARGTFEIVACSLGCVRGASGISCSTTEIHVNEEVRITFNRPVDPSSVSNNSFQFTETGTGITPPSSFALAPDDPSTLVYRPQMTFDSAGNPVFGLRDDRTYLLKLPGQTLDPLGPYVTSVDGLPNQTRLLCTLVASLGAADAVPGRPLVKTYVQVVTERDPVTGEPVEFARVPAEGATDVYRRSPIEFVFRDLMNPATVANPVTGTSSTIRVFHDPDGNVLDRSDQVPVPGSFVITLDQARLVTRAVFQAQSALPPSGFQRRPGRIVVSLSPIIADLAANTLLNAGSLSFTTEGR